jgi:hypothetical protein
VIVPQYGPFNDMYEVSSRGIAFASQRSSGLTITNTLYSWAGTGGDGGFFRHRTGETPANVQILDAGNFLAGTHYLSPSGSGSSLTSLDLNPSLTATVAKAAAALTNITASQIVAAGGVTNVYNDPVLTSSNLLGFAGTTCTITRAMGNAMNLTPTGTVYFAADATLTDTNVVAGFTLDLFYNAQTFGFVGASMTNTATLTSNAWNSIIFWKGRGSSVFVGK